MLFRAALSESQLVEGPPKPEILVGRLSLPHTLPPRIFLTAARCNARGLEQPRTKVRGPLLALGVNEITVLITIRPSASRLPGLEGVPSWTWHRLPCSGPTALLTARVGLNKEDGPFCDAPLMDSQKGSYVAKRAG